MSDSWIHCGKLWIYDFERDSRRKLSSSRVKILNVRRRWTNQWQKIVVHGANQCRFSDRFTFCLTNNSTQSSITVTPGAHELFDGCVCQFVRLSQTWNFYINPLLHMRPLWSPCSLIFGERSPHVNFTDYSLMSSVIEVKFCSTTKFTELSFFFTELFNDKHVLNLKSSFEWSFTLIIEQIIDV